MKILNKLICGAAIIVTTLSCEDSNNVQPVSNSGNTPNFVGYHFKYSPSFGYQANGFIVADLNHESNDDKKYFIIDRFNVDSLSVVQDVLPIDSLGANWPSNVTSVGYGYSSSLFSDAFMRVQVNSIDANGRFVYLYDSIHKSTSGIAMVNYFNNPLYAGYMAGKTPQGEGYFQIPDGTGGVIRKTVLFYFEDEVYTSKLAGVAPERLSSLAPYADIYDWKNVNDHIEFSSGNGGSTHIFFDFNNWQYFVWTQECVVPPSGSTCLAKLILSDYQSLDKLIKWPAGWGKR